MTETETRTKAETPLTFEEWLKVDLRIATITSAEEVRKSNKLLKLELDVGEEEPRVVLAGIKKHFGNLEELVGRQVVYLANLAPRKMFGIESRGMVLAASETRELPPPQEAFVDFLTLLQPIEKCTPGAKIS